MIELLFIFGLSLGAATLFGGSDDDSDVEAPEDPETLSPGIDVVMDESFTDDVQATLDDLVAEGEITQDEADGAFGVIDFVSGPQNLDASGGDDAVLTGDGDDTLDAGSGDDLILSGGGDDFVDLGSGNDVYGVDFRVIDTEDDFQTFPTPEADLPLGDGLSESSLEGGDDTIAGGSGNDAISDSFGSNLINGQQGADFIVSVDDASDQGTADTVKGGFGADTLVVDEGDVVETGMGPDQVVVETYNGVSAGYEVVTVSDFTQGTDALVVQGESSLLSDTDGESPVTVDADGADAVVSINGIPVVRVTGGASLTVDDVAVVIDNR